MSLLLLRLTKNLFVTLATALWGLTLTFLSLVVVFDISDLAPSVNLYGVLFVVAVLISSISLTLFSLIELSKTFKSKIKAPENKKAESTSTQSNEVEGTYQTPTNPS